MLVTNPFKSLGGLHVTFFVVVLADLVPLRGAHSRLLVDALGLPGRVNSGGGGIVVMRATHWRLTHFIGKGQAWGQVVGIEARIRGRRVLVLRGVSGQRGFGIGSERTVVGEAILRANMLKDLLVDVQLGAGVGQSVLVVQAVAEVVLVVLHAAVAAVRGTVQTLGVVAHVVGALALTLVGSVAVRAVHRGVGHGIEGFWLASWLVIEEETLASTQSSGVPRRVQRSVRGIRLVQEWVVHSRPRPD